MPSGGCQAPREWDRSARYLLGGWGVPGTSGVGPECQVPPRGVPPRGPECQVPPRGTSGVGAVAADGAEFGPFIEPDTSPLSLRSLRSIARNSSSAAAKGWRELPAIPKRGRPFAGWRLRLDGFQGYRIQPGAAVAGQRHAKVDVLGFFRHHAFELEKLPGIRSYRVRSHIVAK